MTAKQSLETAPGVPAGVHTGLADPAWRGEWRRNWSVCLSAFFGAGIATFHLQSLGPMIKPLEAAFGWTRTDVTAGLLIVSLGSLIMNPVVGTLIDRFGARKVVLTGIWLYGGALALLGMTGPSPWSWYAVYVLLAIISPTVTSLVWSKAIVDRFDKARGLALGIMRCGLTVTGGMVPIFMVAITQAAGWRAAYAALGGTAILIALPMALLFFRDGYRPAKASVDPPRESLPGVTVREALRDSRFWRLSISLCAAALTTGFFSAHLQPMLTDGGLTPMKAALLTGAIGPIAAVAGLIYGALVDRLPAPPLTAIAFATPIVGCLLILGSGDSMSGARAFAVVLTVGVALGSEGDSIAYLVGRFFGHRCYGAISGLVMSGFVLGFGIGPLIGARVFDVAGSYRPVMLGAAAMLLVSAALVGTLGRYPRFDDETTELEIKG